MARPRSPNRDKAFQLWLESGKKRQLKDIAAELQVSEEQVRKWKNQDKWDKVTLPNEKGNVTKKKKGGQPGNRNAAGGKGGAAPLKNKNAVTTGEFETLLFDCLDDEEKCLAESVPADKQRLLLQEIQLLTVRERRMLKRIEAIKQSIGDKGYGTEEGMTLVSIEEGNQGVKKKYEGKLGQIQAIEEALTRVQARKQRSIESLHKFGYEDSQIKLDAKRVELAARVSGEVEDEEIPDDGFLDALKGNSDWERWNQKDEEEDPGI